MEIALKKALNLALRKPENKRFSNLVALDCYDGYDNKGFFAAIHSEQFITYIDERTNAATNQRIIRGEIREVCYSGRRDDGT